MPHLSEEEVEVPWRPCAWPKFWDWLRVWMCELQDPPSIQRREGTGEAAGGQGVDRVPQSSGAQTLSFLLPRTADADVEQPPPGTCGRLSHDLA